MTTRCGVVAAALQNAARLMAADDSPSAGRAAVTLGKAAANVLAGLAHEPLPDCLRPRVSIGGCRIKMFCA